MYKNELFTFSDSDQLGFKNFLVVSSETFTTFRLKNISTQSMINVIKKGGFPNFLTVEISVAFIV